MKKLLAVLAISGMLMAIPSQSEAQVSVRVGASHMIGGVGIEYQTGNIAVAGGVGIVKAVSAKYLLNAEGNSLWIGAAYVLDRAEVWDNDSDGFLTTEDAPSVGPLVGYKMQLGDSLDLSVGGGYGSWLGVNSDLNEETAGALFDVSLGYSF
jgi:hypothetical protein